MLTGRASDRIRPRGLMIAEPVLVVASREHLWYLLTEASQLEHMIMCQYLFATFSLKHGVEDGLTVEQADGRGLLAQGAGRHRRRRDASPGAGRQPDGGHRRGSDLVPTELSTALRLLSTDRPPRSPPFGERALPHFLYLERPEGMQNGGRAAVRADGARSATCWPRTRRCPGCSSTPPSGTSTEASPRACASRRPGSASGPSSSARHRPRRAGAVPLAATDRGHRPRLGARRHRGDHRTGRRRARRLARARTTAGS